jgi:hypothetical protein
MDPDNQLKLAALQTDTAYNRVVDSHLKGVRSYTNLFNCCGRSGLRPWSSGRRSSPEIEQMFTGGDAKIGTTDDGVGEW